MQEGGEIFMKKSRMAGSGAGLLSRADGGKRSGPLEPCGWREAERAS